MPPFDRSTRGCVCVALCSSPTETHVCPRLLNISSFTAAVVNGRILLQDAAARAVATGYGSGCSSRRTRDKVWLQSHTKKTHLVRNENISDCVSAEFIASNSAERKVTFWRFSVLRKRIRAKEKGKKKA